MVSWAIRGMPPDRPGPGPRPIPMRCGGRARTGDRPPSRCRAVRSPPVMPDRRPGFVRHARRRAGDYRSAATMPAPGHPETPIACPTVPTLIRAPWIRRRSARRAPLRGTTHHPVADPTPPGRAEPRPTPRHQHTPRPPVCRHPACRHPVHRPRERIRRVGRPMGRRCSDPGRRRRAQPETRPPARSGGVLGRGRRPHRLAAAASGCHGPRSLGRSPLDRRPRTCRHRRRSVSIHWSPGRGPTTTTRSPSTSPYRRRAGPRVRRLPVRRASRPTSGGRPAGSSSSAQPSSWPSSRP